MLTPNAALAAIAVHGGDLSFSSALLALLRPALQLTEPDGIIALLSTSPNIHDDLARWCQLEHHRYLGAQPLPDGGARHLIARGSFGAVHGVRERGVRLGHGGGIPTAAEVLAAVPMPDHALTSTGFAPRGARVESGGPSYPFSLIDRATVATPDVATLYDQAISAQWNAATDIPWAKIRPLPDALESALGQIMTFLAENELSALYVPSQFLPRIHPAYAEVAMFLATQLADESRHIDVFLKRARYAGGSLGISSVTTSRSLLSLLQLRDFTEAAFLLSVLGEGTFLDLLKFIEQHAPDEPTAEIARRARADESRHVHFGLSHVRHALAHDPGLYLRLQDAVRKRAATLHGVAGVPAPLQDALIILAARGTDPKAVARGADDFRQLLDTMHQARQKRLMVAGFSAEQADTLSQLHTPNFM